MNTNSFNAAFRHFRKRPLFSFINVLGLAIGLASCALIGLFGWQEWQADRFHEQGDRIYRVVSDLRTSKGEQAVISSVGRPVALTIAEQVPEVERTVSIMPWNTKIAIDGKFYFDKVLAADEHFFEVFSFPLVEGDPSEVLLGPNRVVITERIRKKYFGDGVALGQTLVISDSIALQVTGVAADPPLSHINFDVLVSYATLHLVGLDQQQWFTLDQYCYVLLRPAADRAAAEQKIREISMQNGGESFTGLGYQCWNPIEAVPEIYLFSGNPSALGAIGDIRQLRLLGLIALIILVVAIVNYVNLSTARISDRVREIGIRKTLGADRRALVGQFIRESLFYALVAAAAAILLLELSLPIFNLLTGEVIAAKAWMSPFFLAAFFAFVLLTGVIASLYPALAQARLDPKASLLGEYRERGWGVWLRRGLVVFQFGVAVILIFCTVTVLSQLKFLLVQDPGFEKEQVLVINARQIPGRQIADGYEQIKEALRQINGVAGVSAAVAFPGRQGWDGQVVLPEGRPEEEALTMEVLLIDHDYAELLDLEFVAGRDFDLSRPSDAQGGVILNETACRQIGWTPEEAIGKVINTPGLNDGHVVGVVGDYLHHSLRRGMNPIVFFIRPFSFDYFGVKLSGGGELSQKVEALQSFWNQRFAGFPFDYFFLDQDFNQQYEAEQRLSRTLSLFGFLAIFTSCLGLLGMAVYTTEKRTKEIGIRKVLGATVHQLVTLLNREFLGMVAVSLVVGLPVGWLLMNRWLADFTQRITPQWWMFALAGGLALAIALITVSFQAFRAATADPVESLRRD